MAIIVVEVMLKPEILDPQGQAIASALPRLGFTFAQSVRQGKRFEIEVEGTPTLTVENTNTPWTTEYTKGDRIVIPIKNGEGSFQASDATLAELEAQGRIVLRYADKNPNGSKNDIAGISNARGNVVGVMPHPEQAIESLTGPSTDGLKFFTSVLHSLVGR